MLYIYHEDVGQMIAFDMVYVTKTVRELKTEIEKVQGIPYRHQVLYVSGGQIMDGKVIVGNYKSGTDNNPIWLVDNRCYNQQQPPRAYIPVGPEDTVQESMENSAYLPISYETIVTRSQIAMLFHDIGKEEMKICEGLVKDQHLQYQGWLALKCSLEDKGFALEKNMRGLEKLYDDFLTQRKEALHMMQDFESTNDLIKKIPIPSCLECYASRNSTDSGKLLKESTLKSDGDSRPISSLTSCIERLEKSNTSGPPSGQFASGESSTENPTQDNSVYTDTTKPGSSPAASGSVATPRKAETNSNVSSTEGPPCDESEPYSQSPAKAGTHGVEGGEQAGGVKAKQALIRRRSSRSQSPDVALSVAIPQKQSTQENIQKALREDKYISENKTMQFLISPTGSGQTSPRSPGNGEEESVPESPHRTLSDWIRGNASRDPIEVVKKELEDKFSKLTPEMRDTLTLKCREILKSLDNKSMKEFKGLDKRLAGLEQLLIQMKKLSGNQSDMAQGFVQNQQRVRVEREQSVLPVMCESHKKQLQVMMENHRRLGDIKRRVTAAKQELCAVLHARIRWIMHMEERLREANHDIVMTQGMISKLSGYVKTLRQLHNTPVLFAQGVVEGYRRRKFSQKFLAWAGSWAEENSKIYREEMERRRKFNKNLYGHFLMRMFNGFNEEPPPFATMPPQPFDTKLPPIEETDIEALRKEVPEIAHLLRLPGEPAIGRETSTATNEAQTSPSLTQLESQFIQHSTSTSPFLSPEKDDASSDDIVVLNANGEQSVLTPSPEHKPSEVSQLPSESEPSGIEHAPPKVSPGDITQSVEVILRADESLDESEVAGAVEIPGAVARAKQYAQAGSGSPQPPRSLSLHEDLSYGDDSIGTGSPPFQSIKYTSLQEAALKSPLANSPDLDEYATADFTTDFYIEESIPSAMSNSTPDRTIAELQVQLQEKNTTVEKQEEELNQVKEKLSKLENVIRSLRGGLKELVSPQKVGQLKEDVEYLQQQVKQDKDSMQQDFRSLSESVTQLINRLSTENKALDKTITDLKHDAEIAKQSYEASMQQSVSLVKLETVQGELSSQIRELEVVRCEQAENISGLQKQNGDLEEKVRQFEAVKCKQTENIFSLQKQNGDLEGKVKSLVIDIEKQTDLIKTVQNDKKAVEELLKIEREEKIQSENQIIELEQELCCLQEKISLLEKQFSEANQMTSDKEKEFETKINKLKKEYEQSVALECEKSSEIQKNFEDFQKSSALKCEDLLLKLNRTVDEKSELEAKMTSLNKELDAKNIELREESEKSVNLAKSQLLEHEVELDKIRSELKVEIDAKEEEIQKLQEKLDCKEKETESLKKQFEKSREELMSEFQGQKDDIVKALDVERAEAVKAREAAVREELGRVHEEDVERRLKEKEEHVRRLGEEAKEELVKAHQAALDQLEQQHEEAVKKLEEEHQKKISEEKKEFEEKEKNAVKQREAEVEQNFKEIIEALKQEREKEAKEIKKSLAFDFHKRITEMRSDIEAKDVEVEGLKQALAERDKQVSKLKEDRDFMTLEKHGQIIAQMKEAWVEEKLQAVNQALGEVQVKHEEEISTLIEKLEKEKEDSLTTMKTSQAAENQVLFNEALDKAVSDKDRVIEELRSKEVIQKEAIEKLTSELESMTSGEMVQQLEADLAKAKDAEKQAVISQRSCEQELSKLKQQMQRDVASLGLSGMTQSLMGQSVLTQSVTPVTESASLRERLHQLETENKAQAEELVALRAQMRGKLGGDVHPQALIPLREKVSIHTFDKGDIVLLCLDEKYDHYVVFTIGPVLHFLHSDCYDALRLKPVEGETRKLWVLARLVEKEYCQARKAQNRFKVPIGTKFYRVRCHPYEFPVAPFKVKATDQAEGGTQAAEARMTDSSVDPDKSKVDKTEVGDAVASELEASVHMGLPEPKS